MVCPPPLENKAEAVTLPPERERTCNPSVALTVCRPADETPTEPTAPAVLAPRTITSLADVKVCVPLLFTVSVDAGRSLLTTMSPLVTVENDWLPPVMLLLMVRSPAVADRETLPVPAFIGPLTVSAPLLLLTLTLPLPGLAIPLIVRPTAVLGPFGRLIFPGVAFVALKVLTALAVPVRACPLSDVVVSVFAAIKLSGSSKIDFPGESACSVTLPVVRMLEPKPFGALRAMLPLV